jgi:uncharacterized protein YajQ (UPF0234 family)
MVSCYCGDKKRISGVFAVPSFDVVSEVDLHEFTNAIDQAGRIIGTRFDFKGVDAKFDRQELTVTLFAEADFQTTQMEDMLRTALIKCKIDPLAMTVGESETAGKQVKVLVTMQNGLESELARKIVKMIKEKKLKVQSQIQGDQVRVTGKKRDDLQSVMAVLREAEFDQPLQFDNFRD